MSDDEQRAAITELRKRDDDAATRELVAFLDANAGYSLEAARELERRDVPDDLRERVAAGLLAGDPARAYTYHAGARALVGHPRAIELAEPLLRVDVLASDDVRRRAAYVLDAVEAQLARATTAAPPALPDPRWRELAAEAARLDPDLDWYADAIDAGFRFFAGHDVEPAWRRIDFLADNLLPFVVAGVKLPEDRGPDERRNATYPPGMVIVDHQYACISCGQASVMGYAVAVPDDPPLRAALDELNTQKCDFYGAPLTAAEIAAWSARLAPLLDGAIAEGAEGLVIGRGARAPLTGLPLVRFGTRFAPWRWNIDVEVNPDVVQAGHYADAHERAVLDLARQLALPPCTAIVMANCD